MYEISATSAFDFNNVALNPKFQHQEAALLNALLQSSDYGVLVSGLDREDIVANRRLGELFGVSPQHVVRTDSDAVRALALSRVQNPQMFEEVLRRVYADPLLTYEDEIELIGNPPRTLRRFTAPIYGSDNTHHNERSIQPLGRLWTFLDVTETRRLKSQVQAQLTIFLHLSQDKILADLIPRFKCLVKGDDDQHQLTLLPHHEGPIAAQLQWQSFATVPLCQNGVLNGIFLMGVPEILENTQAVLRHLSAVADQIMLMLQSHHLQSELHQTLDTLQLTQRRMVEIEKLRTAGTLAASIAHDIRNIMTAVQIAMEIASLPEGTVFGIGEHLKRFSTLTHRLLAFARPGTLDLCLQDVGDILRRVLELIAGQAEVHRVQIELELPEHLPLVAADAIQLEHLSVNLCLNGIQAMAQHSGLLRLSGVVTSEGLQIDIHDTGDGISPDIIDQIFEPFFTTRATGTGLGLFSCKRIVEEHGGHLKVRSCLDNGATFTVLLPIGPLI